MLATRSSLSAQTHGRLFEEEAYQRRLQGFLLLTPLHMELSRREHRRLAFRCCRDGWAHGEALPLRHESHRDPVPPHVHADMDGQCVARDAPARSRGVESFVLCVRTGQDGGVTRSHGVPLSRQVTLGRHVHN